MTIIFDSFISFSQTSDKPKATSTIFIDNDNVQQLPKLVDLLTRDGQEIPLDLFTISQVCFGKMYLFSEITVQNKPTHKCFSYKFVNRRLVSGK